MIRKIQTFIAALTLALFGVAVPVLAQEETENEEVMQTTAAPAEEKPKSRSERLEEYKQQKKQKLAEFKKNRLITRCKASQGKISSFQARVKNAAANRNKVYREIGEKLDRLILKLQAAAVDTSALETAREDMQVQLDALIENLTAYETVLADLTEMDCAADPEAFQAALELAREHTKQLRTSAQEFRRFVTTQLRAILQDIRKGLSGGGNVSEDVTADETESPELENDETNSNEGGEQ